MKRHHGHSLLIITAISALTLAGCASVPARMASPTLTDTAPLAGLPVPTDGVWPEADWWKRYHDPQLDALIARALQSSPTLAQAQARVTVAEQQIVGKRAAGAPYLAGSATVARQRISDNGFIPSQFLGFSWYTQADIGAQFQYEFDFWGKQRALVDASVDQARAANADRSAAWLVLTSSVAETYFGWLADQGRLAMAKRFIAGLQAEQRVVQARERQGLDSSDPTSDAAVDLQTARQQEIIIEGSAQLRKANLAALLGVAPADSPELAPRPFPQAAVALPADVGIGLIGRRPDIAATRWRIEAASEQVAKARADFYPDISIKALIGLSSIDLGKLFEYGSRVADVAPAISLPLFDGGRLKAAYGSTRAQLDLAISDYNAAVVSAARDVATQALTLQQLAAQREQQAQEIASVEQIRATAAARVRQGIADDRTVLAVQVRLLREQDNALQLAARSLSTQVELIRALGGGYTRVGDGNPALDPTTSNAAPTPSDGTNHP